MDCVLGFQIRIYLHTRIFLSTLKDFTTGLFFLRLNLRHCITYTDDLIVGTTGKAGYMACFQEHFIFN